MGPPAMIEYYCQTIHAQLQASLAMLGQCIARCPAEHWTGKIAKYDFWHVAYHTLYCTDVYLAPSWDAFEPCEFLPAGKDEIELEFPSREMTPQELAGYLRLIRRRASEAIAAESPQSLQQAAGFHWLRGVSRGEVYLYSIRHVMHHTGQLAAYLRRTAVDTDWIKRATIGEPDESTRKLLD